MRTTQRYGNRYYNPPLGAPTWRESLSTKLVAGGLGIILGAGGLALGEKVWPHDPNQLKDCETNWINLSTGTDNRVTDMPGAMTALEIGRSKLVSAIHEAKGSDFSIINKDGIPSPYKGAAKLLIGNESGYTNYDTSESRLDSPREAFCIDPAYFEVYKTPDYVRAAAALEAAGIEMETVSGNSNE